MELKEAVELAQSYVKELFSEDIRSEPRLEEFELKQAPTCWLVTVSFLRGEPTGGPTSLLTSRRHYKVVTIRDHDRMVLSVKDRELA